MSAPRLSARRAGQLVTIGQRWRRRRDGLVAIVHQVHRVERRIEAHFEGDDPRAPRTRFYITFVDLGSKYEPLEATERAA